MRWLYILYLTNLYFFQPTDRTKIWRSFKLCAVLAFAIREKYMHLRMLVACLVVLVGWFEHLGIETQMQTVSLAKKIGESFKVKWKWMHCMWSRVKSVKKRCMVWTWSGSHSQVQCWMLGDRRTQIVEVCDLHNLNAKNIPNNIFLLAIMMIMMMRENIM